MSDKSKSITSQDIKLAAFEALYERHGGRMSPRIILDEAASPSSPFHDEFIWDNEVAGEGYRLAQAAQLIRKWRGAILRIDQEKRVVHVEVVRRAQSPERQRGKGHDSYRTIEDIMADPDMREDMLRTVLKELNAYRKRYAQLYELAEVWAALDGVIEQHTPRARTDVEERPSV